MRECCAGISLYPKLEGFFDLFHVPGDRLLEASCDEVLLRLARSVAQFESFAVTLNIHAEFARIIICKAQPCVGECKIWVEFDGLLIKRDSRSIPGNSMNLKT